MIEEKLWKKCMAYFSSSREMDIEVVSLLCIYNIDMRINMVEIYTVWIFIYIYIIWFKNDVIFSIVLINILFWIIYVMYIYIYIIIFNYTL